MKKTLATMGAVIAAAVVVSLTGCATFSYESAEGSKIRYARLGDQEIGGLRLKKADLEAQIEKQRSDVREELKALVEALGD